MSTARRRRRAADLLVAVAMVYPTLGAWVYFVLLAGSDQARWVYLLSKGAQLALPLAWLVLATREQWRLRLGRLRGWGTAAGIASGLLLAAGLLLVDAAWLAGTPLAAGAVARIQAKLADFAISTPLAYLAMALALSVVHSLFEEVYWRWLVFGRLSRRFSPAPAVALASLAFASHHVIVISRFAPASAPVAVTLVASLAVAGAGALWCLLYLRTGGLLSPWLSHLLADAALMAVGYRLLWGW